METTGKLPLTLRQLDIELFGGCNYECVMCPQKDGGRETDFKKVLPKEIFFKIVDDGVANGAEAVSLHGSGEPTMCKYLPEAIAYAKSKGLTVISFTNGATLTEKLARSMIEAGLDTLRISAIGYDEESYAASMGKPYFQRVRDNAKRFHELCQGTRTKLHIYHLITDNTRVQEEIEGYRRNWTEYVGAETEIWLMHNWAGSYADVPYSRASETRTKRTCGRPFQPMLQVRAGGHGKQNGAVVACCMVLGRDSEAVLGHLDTQSIAEVWNGEPFRDLRRKHLEGRFDEISFCKDCDQLYDVPESLVWTNIPGRKYDQSKVLADLAFTSLPRAD